MADNNNGNRNRRGFGSKTDGADQLPEAIQRQWELEIGQRMEALRAWKPSVECQPLTDEEILQVVYENCQHEESINDEPPLPREPITQAGDLWLLGNHRLLCGDSCNLRDVKRLMDSQKAVCVFTDPPYGVNIGSKNRMLNGFQKADRKLEDLHDDKPESIWNLLPAFQNCRTNIISKDGSLFCCSPSFGELPLEIMSILRESNLVVKHTIVWVKNAPTFSLGRLDYDYQHECIFYTWVGSRKSYKQSLTSTVWRFDRLKCSLHPTMKPVELYETAFLNHTDKEDIVADMFAGSGTIFMAAERTGRVGYGLEIDARHCDAILRRWTTWTGQDVVRERDGVSYLALRSTDLANGQDRAGRAEKHSATAR